MRQGAFVSLRKLDFLISKGIAPGMAAQPPEASLAF
jgi:hypothetical protein